MRGSSPSPQPSKSELRSSRPREERGEGEVVRRFRFEVPVANSRHPVQELQIGGTRACTHKSTTLTDVAMSALPSEADIRASLQPVRFVPILLQKSAR